MWICFINIFIIILILINFIQKLIFIIKKKYAMLQNYLNANLLLLTDDGDETKPKIYYDIGKN